MARNVTYSVLIALLALVVLPAVMAYGAGNGIGVHVGNSESLDEAPGPFDLQWPADGEVYSCSSCLPYVNFCWEESTDPDYGDTVRYELIVHLIPENGPDTTITVSGLDGLSCEVFTQPFMPGEGNWWVLAVSGGDTTESNQRWTFSFVEETGVKNEPETAVPRGLDIVNIYPNPFNSTAVFRIESVGAGEVSLVLTDLLGRTVREGFSGEVPAQGRSFVLEAGDLPAGIYFLRAMTASGETSARKVILLK